MVHSVSYMGAVQITYSLNFSKPAAPVSKAAALMRPQAEDEMGWGGGPEISFLNLAQIWAQYYNFIALGREGYAKVIRNLLDVRTCQGPAAWKSCAAPLESLAARDAFRLCRR